MIAEAMHSESRTTEARPGLAPFPVEWRGAEDAGRHWVRQRAHFPAPVTPLFFSTADLLVGAGYRRAVAHYESAVVDRPIRRINTYFYAGLVPFGGRAAEQAARAQRNTAAIQKVMGRLEEFWTREWLPEIEYHLAIWDAFKLRRATLPALVNHLDETIIRGSRLWELHFLLTAPVWTALAEFVALYRQVCGTADAQDAYRLLQGFDNKTLTLGRAFYELSVQARAYPEIMRALTTPAGDSLALLDQSGAGRSFGVLLRAFLATYGRRSSFWDWGYPSWIEDPAPVLATLRHWLARPDFAHGAVAAAQAADREQSLAAARARLAHHPSLLGARFERLLPVAQTAVRIGEDHRFYIAFAGMYRVRRVIAEFGHRFAAAGLLDDPGGVFYLTLDELRASATGDPAGRRTLVATRRAEMAYWGMVAPPAELGTRTGVAQMRDGGWLEADDAGALASCLSGPPG